MALAHGGLGAEALHLVVDMQRLFAVPGAWCVPGLPAILPQVEALARHRPGRTLFTRFVVPQTAGDAQGVWQQYYRHWSSFTGAVLTPGLLDLAGSLTALAADGEVIDKPGHSGFGASDLHARLQARGAAALVVSGVETDVCVLATVLQAVDLGYRVVLAADAVASSSEDGHAATLAHVLPRLDQQVEIADTATILAAWS